MMLNNIRKPIVALACAGLVLVGCGKKDSAKGDPENTTSTTTVGTGTNADGTVTLTGSLSLGSTALTAESLGDLILYCITFESVPAATSSMFDTSGGFSIKVKANIPFGCFVNNKTSGKTIASIVVDSGDSKGLGGSSSAMALAGGVSLGALTIGSDGTIRVPAAVLAGVKPPTTDGIDLNAMHNSTYKMECQGSGDRYNACMEMLQDGDAKGSMTIMARILKGKEGGSDIRGMGVWKNKAAFDACGGFDMNAAETAKIAAEGIVLSQNSVGEFAGANCAKRNEGKEYDSRNIEDYYAMSKLIPIAGGYSFMDEDYEEYDACKSYHSTAIDFTGSATEMYGAFSVKNLMSGTCNHQGAKNEQAVFNVKFTKLP